MTDMTRRRFIHSSLVSAGALSAAACATGKTKRPLPAAGTSGKVIGANERIRVGLIGSGGMGRGDLLAFLKFDNVDCPVVCDVDDAQIKKAGDAVEKLRGKRPDGVKDFRRVIDRKDVDVCLVATPDHWHALPTIYACQAGKDVYVEKPLATSIGEGRAMLGAARRHDRVVQMGTQWRSGEHYQDAIEYVHSGKLGQIRLVRCWPYLLWVHDVGWPEDEKPPSGVDYNMWLGPAPKRPFNRARFHFSFRWFWDYAGGLQTDWGVHLLNLAHWGMKVRAPLRVSSSGGKYVWNDISETPDTQVTIFDYPSFTLLWEHQNTGGHGPEGREHGIAFHGTEGTLILDSRGWEVAPEEGKTLEKAGGKPGSEYRKAHVGDFLDCVRSRKRPVSDIGIGHGVTTTAHLGNIALQTKRSIHWDAANERIVDDKKASKLLTKPYRGPWKLPA